MQLSSDRLLKLGRFVLIFANVLVIAALEPGAARATCALDLRNFGSRNMMPLHSGAAGMVGELERFRERLHGKDKEPGKFKIREWLPIVVASTALVWSIVRTVDDVRVAVGYDWPRIDVKERKAHHDLRKAKSNLHKCRYTGDGSYDGATSRPIHSD
jgi:hypothetical protein